MDRHLDPRRGGSGRRWGGGWTRMAIREVAIPIDPRPSDGDAEPEAPAAARWFVRIFLSAFLVCSIFGVEWWPLTGFRLFSHVRTAHRIQWTLDTVASGGVESPLWLGDVPRAYQGFHLIMPGFSRLQPAVQQATCAAWLAEARRVRTSVSEIRIYRVEWQSWPRAGERPARPPSKKLVYACA